MNIKLYGAWVIMALHYLYGANLYAQTNSGKSNEPKKLPLSQFIDSVNKATTILTQHRHYSVNECILLARVDNTLSINHLKNNEAVNRYYASLKQQNSTKVLDEQMATLGAIISYGMGYYSEKYDISIGGNPNANSYYVITK